MLHWPTSMIVMSTDCKYKLDRQGVWHEWGRGEMRTGFWWGYLKKTEHLEEYLPLDERIILKLILNKSVARACTGLSWLRIGTVDERL
jgi:hypothetical protein